MNTQINNPLIPTNTNPIPFIIKKNEEENFEKIISQEVFREDFTEELHNLKIIDVNGHIVTDVANKMLPILLPGQANEIFKLLNSKFEVAFDEKINNKTCHHKSDILINELINFLIAGNHKEHYKVFIRGGYLRKLLLNQDYFSSALKLLGVQNPEKILTEDIFRESKRKVPDVDFVIKIPQSETADLYSYGNKVIEYLNEVFFENTYKGHQRIKKHAFTKFNVMKGGGNEFAIITLKGGNGLQLELLIERELKRKKLFSVDDFQVEITPLLDKNATKSTPLLIQSSYGLQSLLDLGTKTIHVEKPEEVNEYGFPVLLSYYSRGYMFPEADHLTCLVNKSATLSDQLIIHISKVIAEHHNNDPLTAIPMIFHSCLKLEGCFSEDAIANLIEKITKTYLQGISEKIQNGSLLALISDAIFNKKIPIHILKACLELGAIYRLATEDSDQRDCKITIKPQIDEGMPSVQIRLNEGESTFYFLFPFSLQDSVEKIKYYFLHEGQSSENLTCLTTILEKIMDRANIFKQNGLLPLLKFRKPFMIKEEKLSSMAKELLSSKNRPLRFFGYVIQLTLGSTFPNTKYINDLLFHYIDATNFAKVITLQNQVLSIIGKTKYSPLSLPKDNFMLKFHKTYKALNIKKNLIKWACCLAETQDRSLCDISYQLWITHASKYNENEQKKFGMQLLLQLLPHGVDYAIRILRSLQENIQNKLTFEEETTALSKIISSIRGLENTLLGSESTQQIQFLINRFLKKLIAINRANNQLPSTFIEQFYWFIQHKLAQQDPQNAHFLLLQASKMQLVTRESLENSLPWLATFHLSLKNNNITKAYDVWESGESHQVWRNVCNERTYQICLITLAENLHRESLRSLSETKVLDTLSSLHSNNPEINKRIASIAANTIDSQLELPYAKEGLESLNKKYRKHFTPVEVIDIKLKSIALHFNKKNFENGFNIWKDLVKASVVKEKKEAVTLETEKMLNVLTNEQSSIKDLHLACQILTSKSLESWIKKPDLLRAQYFTKCLINVMGKGKPEKLSVLYFVLENTLNYVFKTNQTVQPETKRDASKGLVFVLKGFASPQFRLPDSLKQKLIECYPNIVKFHHDEARMSNAYEIIESVENQLNDVTYDDSFASLCLNSLKVFYENFCALEDQDRLLLTLSKKINLKSKALQQSLFYASKTLIQTYLQNKNSDKAIFWMKTASDWAQDDQSISEIYDCSLQLMKNSLIHGTEFVDFCTKKFPESKKDPSAVAALWNYTRIQGGEMLAELCLSKSNLLMKIFDENTLKNEVMQLIRDFLDNKKDCINLKMALQLLEKHVPSAPQLWLEVLKAAEFSDDRTLQTYASSIFHSKIIEVELFEDQLDCVSDCWVIWLKLLNQLGSSNQATLLSQAVAANSPFDRIFTHEKQFEKRLIASQSLIYGNLNIIGNFNKKDPAKILNSISLLHDNLKKKSIESGKTEFAITKLDVDLINNLIEIQNSQRLDLAIEILDKAFKDKFSDKTSLSLIKETTCRVAKVIKEIGNTAQRNTFSTFLNAGKTKELLGKEKYSFCAWCILKNTVLNTYTKKNNFEYCLPCIITLFDGYKNIAHHQQSEFEWIDLTVDYIVSAFRKEIDPEMFKEVIGGYLSLVLNDVPSFNHEQLLQQTTEIQSEIESISENRYFRAMTSLLLRFMDQEISCDISQRRLSSYIVNTLVNLAITFPKRRIQIIDIADKYLFCIKIDRSVRANLHQECAILLMKDLIKVKAYEHSSELLFKHQLFFDPDNITDSDLSAEKKAEIVNALILETITYNTDFSLVKAATMVSATVQLPLSTEKLAAIFNSLIRKLDEFPFAIHNQYWFFGVIGSALVQTYINKPKCKQITGLFSILVEKIFTKVYLRYLPSVVPKEFYYKKIQIFRWFYDFLNDAIRLNVFEDELQRKKYITLLEEKIIPGAIKLLPTINTMLDFDSEIQQSTASLLYGNTVLIQDDYTFKLPFIENLSPDLRKRHINLTKKYINALIEQKKANSINQAKYLVSFFLKSQVLEVDESQYFLKLESTLKKFEFRNIPDSNRIKPKK